MSLFVAIEKQLGSFRLQTAFQTELGVTGLLGASGCGKSMTLQCIAGIQKPDRGRIVLDGEVLFDSEKGINRRPQERGVGYLFQNYALFPNMTVEQNILCGLHREKDPTARRKALHETMALLQLEALAQHKPYQLSGGQAQRTALARILVNQPRILLLDEPFSALDTHLRDQLQLQLQELLQTFRRDVVLVTHSRDEAYHLCHKLAVMEDGRLLGMKDTKALFAAPETVTAARITGCKNMTAAQRVDDHTLYAPAWGVKLETAWPIPDQVDAVGIRAHYFHPRTATNRFPVQFTGGMEEPFERIIRFRYQTQAEGTPDIWWRLPKDRFQTAETGALGVSPTNVLPLRSGKKPSAAETI